MIILLNLFREEHTLQQQLNQELPCLLMIYDWNVYQI